MDWVPKESEIKIDKVNIDSETANMLKSRFGTDIYSNIENALEVKVHETGKKERKGGKRGEKKDRAQRQPKEKREEDKKEQKESK